MQFSSNNSGASKVRIGATYSNRVALAKELRERAFSKETSTNLGTELSGLRQIPAIDALSRAGEYFMQNYVGPTSYATPRYAMGGARGGVAVSPMGAGSEFIENAGEEFVRSNAESLGQVSNEYLNKTPIGMLAKPFLGTDVLSKAVGSINAGAGESMTGKVTPMDIANVASLAPIPAGAAAKTALMAGKLLGPTAERLAVPVLRPMFEPLGALVGGGSTTRESLGRSLASLLDSTGARVAGNASRVAEQGSNINFATSQDIWGMSNDIEYKSPGSTNTKTRTQRKKAADRFKDAETNIPANVSRKDVQSWAQDVTNANPNFPDKMGMDDTYWQMGHNLKNPHLKGKGSLEPTHYVEKHLNQLADTLMRSKNIITKDMLKDGQDYTPILKYILDNPNDPLVVSNKIYNDYPMLLGASLPDAAEMLGVNHLMRCA